MSDTDNIARAREIADALDEAAQGTAWIAGHESEKDAARTLADNEVLTRVAGEYRAAADAAEAAG